MSLALATRRLPSEWLAEDDVDLVTALQLLDEQAQQMEEANRGR